MSTQECANNGKRNQCRVQLPDNRWQLVSKDYWGNDQVWFNGDSVKVTFTNEK